MLSHFRTQSSKEVYFVLKNTAGEIIGIEVKSSKNMDKKYLSGLIELKELCESKFKKGIILYTGNDIIPITKKFG